MAKSIDRAEGQFTAENSQQLTNSLTRMESSMSEISNVLTKIAVNSGAISQSTARDNFRQAYRNQGSIDFRRQGANISRSIDRQTKGFLDNFQKALFGGFNASGFKSKVHSIFDNFAYELETSISGIPDELGKRAGEAVKQAAMKNTNIKKLTDIGTNFKSDVSQTLSNKVPNILSNIASGKLDDAIDGATILGDDLVSLGKTALTNAKPALAELGKSALAAGPQIAAVAAAAILLKTAFNGLKQIGEALGKVFKSASAAANRDQESRKRNLELANTRMKEDYEVLVRQPFELLKQASQSLINAWNNNLTTIAATQGYTKADVQDLMSVIGQRLQSEGLSSYISGSDIFDNLAKVLSSGMSGAIAEEFAYQATILNKAIPTQDFFGYASTYASIAANAVRAGQSQNQAIQTANKSLQDFASGLLYASRELTGGFTTGLQNASSLYEQSAKIAQAAHSENMATISGVLLAAQGYIGAVAPDLASGIVDTIYRALVGGNASDIVALRSLANINASNTEFLREFANNPKKVFTNLFTNLARMFGGSSDAFMEKAEGYAQLFGLSVEAFQRVDFAGLAEAIRNMNTSSTALDENMKLLTQGQTTTTAEQLKAQQINQYMIEEGLSYVIDNEAAQMIQEHMWNEQMARELMEAQYSVDLKGSSLELLEALKNTVNNILNFLNPLAWIKKLANLTSTGQEAWALHADTAQLLELGKVGRGNPLERERLTTYNANLALTKSLVELMGGSSVYSNVKQNRELFNLMANPFNAMSDNTLSLSAIAGGLSSNATNRPTSAYGWGSISKSQGLVASNLLNKYSTELVNSPIVAQAVEAGAMASSSASVVKARLDTMLAESYLVDQFVKQGKSFEDWAGTAAKFGISDLDEALQAAGYNAADIKNYFQAKETEQGVAEAHETKLHEKLFRDTGIKHWTQDFPNDFRDPLFDTLATTNDTLANILATNTSFVAMYKTEWLTKGWPAFVSTQGSSGLFNRFFREFVDYFINHTYYSNTTGYRYEDVVKIQEEKAKADKGDTIHALAEMLTTNILDLKDPTMQTNALLAQILILVDSINTHTNPVSAANTATSSLMESIQALAMGLVGGSSAANNQLTRSIDSTIL